jgi:hypothetical protein
MITMTVREGRLSRSGAATGASVLELASAFETGRLFEVSSTQGATMALARLLCSHGVPDGPYEAVGEDGQFHGPSLHRLAKLTVQGGESGPRIVAYAEHPGAAAFEATVA